MKLFKRSDEALQKKYYEWTFYKEEWFNENDIEQKFIVTFSLKYMNYQRTIRNEQIARAEKALSSAEKSERTRQTDYKRFITRISVTEDGEVAEKKVYALNKDKIRDEEQAENIIKINHRRWEIEECFRIMKHEFGARPVYLRKDSRITAHFTTCFLALVLFRYLEKRLDHKYTSEQIVKGLRKMKFLKLKDAGYSPAYTRSDFTDDLHSAFGFHTDFEILSKAKMRNCISQTRKR